MQRTYLALAVLLLAPPVLALESNWPGMRPPVAPPPLTQTPDASTPSGIVALEVIPYQPPTGDS
ncbi:MAG: hypothetical protein FJ077_16100 [Cyanobacteria bacterium K_DeepCast_35m_m2_023]|nr:hypothetical protein [Cyanobacteria bacterium K_DeepCast_35m_m2_023]